MFVIIGWVVVFVCVIGGGQAALFIEQIQQFQDDGRAPHER